MNPLAAIHVAKKQLDMQDDDYRAVLFRVAGKSSARDLSPGQCGLVLDEFRRMGFQPASPRRNTKPSAKGAMALEGRYAAKLRALWISGWHLGVVRDRTDRALLAFVERQTRLSHTSFLRDPVDAAKAIEGLKKWLSREAAVVWPGARPAPYATKRAVIAAQLKALGLPTTNADSIFDLDQYIADLGEQIRIQRGIH